MKKFSNSSRSPRGRRQMGGFTLIELIVVITILGVLAAVALPRFTTLQADARAAKAAALLGSMKAAAAIVKSTALVKSVDCTAATVVGGVTLEGQAIDLAYCYPQALTSFTNGILVAAGIASTDVSAPALAAGVLTLTIPGGSACSITYTAPTAANGSPTFSAPPATGVC